MNTGTSNSPHSSQPEALLKLSGHIIDADGFLLKFHALREPPSKGRPHGILFALCLYGPAGVKLFSLDNDTVEFPGSIFTKSLGIACHMHPYDLTARRCSDEWLSREFRDAMEVLSKFFEQASVVMDIEGRL